jgi:hypothetical protein
VTFGEYIIFFRTNSALSIHPHTLAWRLKRPEPRHRLRVSGIWPSGRLNSIMLAYRSQKNKSMTRRGRRNEPPGVSHKIPTGPNRRDKLEPPRGVVIWIGERLGKDKILLIRIDVRRHQIHMLPAIWVLQPCEKCFLNS